MLSVAHAQVGGEPRVMFPKQSGQNHFKKEGAAGGEVLTGSVCNERFQWSTADGNLKGMGTSGRGRKRGRDGKCGQPVSRVFL